MKTETQTVVKTIYRSEVIPEVETDYSDLAKILKWADANPYVWHIVTHNKSKVFGRILGSNSPDIILVRLRRFYEKILRPDVEIEGWRAHFALEHYKDKGFKGGLFQQWDDQYPRACLILDYTPETLEEVIDKFVEWCGKTHNTRRITINEEIVREYKN